ncbi:MAG: hypothetical protein KF844_06705 [Cryobacterium sp.]|nr:hypothetical protein [Cryobacterium sp.]
MRFAIRRSRSQLGLLATIAATSFIVVSISSGLIGYLDFNAITATREFVATTAPTARAIEVETRLSADPNAQSKAAEHTFRTELSGIPISIDRTLVDYPLPTSVNGSPLRTKEGFEARITAASDFKLTSLARLMDGSWPSENTAGLFEGVIQADAATSLGLKIGDTLELGTGESTRSIKLVGTWLAINSENPHWFSDPGVTTGLAKPGGDGTPSFGPLFISEPALAQLGPDPFVHWTIAIDSSRLTPYTLEKLSRKLGTLKDSLAQTPNFSTSEITIYGDVENTAQTVRQGLASSRGVSPIGLIILTLVALITLSQLARLLSYARRAENALLRSRGASAGWLTMSGILEISVVVGTACAAGVGASAITLNAIYGEVILYSFPWLIAPIALLAVLLIFGFDSFRASMRFGRREEIDDSGRLKVSIAGVWAGVAIAAAAIATWQSLLLGTPLVSGQDGQVSVNPLVVAAPAIDLVAAGFCFLLLLTPLAKLWSRIAARFSHFQPAYSARQTSRRIANFAVAVVVITLSVGNLILSATYSGTSAELTSKNAELTAGSDLRISVAASNITGSNLGSSQFKGMNGVDAVAPVLSTDIAIGDDDSGRLTAIASASIPAIVSEVGGAVDTNRLRKLLGTPNLRGIELPAGATSFSMRITTEVLNQFTQQRMSTKGSVGAKLWLQNAEGELVEVSSPLINLHGNADTSPIVSRVQSALPESVSSWWLVAIDYRVSADAGLVQSDFDDLTVTDSTGQVRPDVQMVNWSSEIANTIGISYSPIPGGIQLGMAGNGSIPQDARLMEAASVQVIPGQLLADAPPPIPVVVSADLSRKYDVKVGDPFSIRFAGSGLSVQGTIVGVVPVLPGIQAHNMVLADLTAVDDYILRLSHVIPAPNQYWISTDLTDSIISELGSGVSSATSATVTNNRFTAPSELALWIATAGTLVLGLFSLGAVCAAVLRARRGEVPVLRAVGLTAAGQAASRFGELTALISLAIVAGIVAGQVAAWLTMMNLVRSAILNLPTGLTNPLSPTLGLTLALLVITILGLLFIAGWSSLLVRRAALNTSKRIEF